MQEKHTAGAGETSSHKDNNFSDIDPVFDFGFINELNAEAEEFIKQGNEASEIKENKFPVEIFPLLFQELINECHKSLNFPTDYTGTAIIAAVSTAIGKSAKLKVKAVGTNLQLFSLELLEMPGQIKVIL
jgi:hypothetical protein